MPDFTTTTTTVDNGFGASPASLVLAKPFHRSSTSLSSSSSHDQQAPAAYGGDLDGDSSWVSMTYHRRTASPLRRGALRRPRGFALARRSGAASQPRSASLVANDGVSGTISSRWVRRDNPFGRRR